MPADITSQTEQAYSTIEQTINLLEGHRLKFKIYLGSFIWAIATFKINLQKLL